MLLSHTSAFEIFACSLFRFTVAKQKSLRKDLFQSRHFIGLVCFYGTSQIKKKLINLVSVSDGKQK